MVGHVGNVKSPLCTLSIVLLRHHDCNKISKNYYAKFSSKNQHCEGRSAEVKRL